MQSQHSLKLNGATLRVIRRSRRQHCVHIQLEGGASLLTLGHVFNQTASDGGVIVGEVHLSRTGTIGKARDESTERSGLTKRSTDAGGVDFFTSHLKGPRTNVCYRLKIGELDGEVTGAVSAVVSD